jgi:ribosomal protein S18 acetylase RimI-like enzyme
VSLVFRRPDLAEAREMAGLHIACWREAYAEIVPRAILDAADIDQRTEVWEKVLSDQHRFASVAYDGSLPVGFINAGTPVDPSGKPREMFFEGQDGHIHAIYILNAYSRQGIGRTLMAAAARWWLGQGGQSLALGVLAENAKARLFYEALGGRLVKTSTFNWHGFDLPDAIYVFEDLVELAASGA